MGTKQADVENQKDALTAAFKAIIQVLDGSQPIDIPGAISVAQYGLKLLDPTMTSFHKAMTEMYARMGRTYDPKTGLVDWSPKK